MPLLSSKSVTILDGEVVLTLRANSTHWQARFKIGTRWLRVTTKQHDLEKAKTTAREMYLRAKFRHDEGIPVVSKRFSAVAKLAVEKMQRQLETGEGKSVFKDYVIATNNYLVPFFGKHNITSIDFGLMKQFATWRAEKMGHEPTISTIATHNSALNRIFDEAMERGFMTKTHIPKLENKGVKSERRPDFSLSEYRQLFRHMRSWIKGGKEGKSRLMRELLRDYVLILANTGMRHGTESYGLKWKNITLFKDKGREFLLMHVNGKTGQRELVARHNVVAYLQRIHKRSDDIKHLSFDELLAKGIDKEVFRLPDGSKTKGLNQTFEILLTDAKLLVDRNTEKNRTLYSLRHTYATFGLVYAGLPIHLLAKQMGTSVTMIEKHYSHLTPRLRANELAGYNFLENKKPRAREKSAENGN